MKCIVRLCPNDSSDGKFFGDLCSPCHDVLSGKPTSQAASRLILAPVMLDGVTIKPSHE